MNNNKILFIPDDGSLRSLICAKRITCDIGSLIRSAGSGCTVISGKTNDLLMAPPSRIVSMIELALAKRDNCTVIFTGYPSTVSQIADFFELLPKHPDLPQNPSFVYVYEQGKRIGDKSIVRDYAHEVVGRTGGVAFSIPAEVSLGVTRESFLVSILAKLAQNPEQITICGTAATGKTSLSNGINKALGYRALSAGRDFAEPVATKLGLTLEALIDRLKTDSTINYDKLIDDCVTELGATGTKFVLDCRMGPRFVPRSFMVYITAPMEIVAERVINDQINHPEKRANREQCVDVADAIQKLSKRDSDDRARYQKIYEGYDFMDPSKYHCVLNSADYGKEEIVKKCIREYITFLIGKFLRK